jgi:hypothetical protein
MMPNRLLDLLLEAEPDELRGLGMSEVARLVREQEDVRTMAPRIRAGLEEANASLEELAFSRGGPMRHADVVGQSRFRSAPGRTDKQQRRPGTAGSGLMAWSSRRRLRLAAGLAIAAIATITLYAPRGGSRPTRSATESPRLSASLSAGSDRPFAVFETENPDIVVVWLFPKEESR